MNARVHAYRIDTREASALGDEFFACLPASEWCRVHRLRRPQDQLNRKVAYAAMHWLAHRHCGTSPGQIGIRRDADGKPFLVLPHGTTPLHISLSHSGHCVVLALSCCPVGIDVEKIRPLDIALLKHDYFPRDTLDPATPLQSLFALWTAKEAVLKAVGKGVHIIDPASLVVRLPGSVFQPLDDWPPGYGLGAAQVAGLMMPAGYTAAIAVLHPRPQVEMCFLDTHALFRLPRC